MALTNILDESLNRIMGVPGQATTAQAGTGGQVGDPFANSPFAQRSLINYDTNSFLSGGGGINASLNQTPSAVPVAAAPAVDWQAQADHYNRTTPQERAAAEQASAMGVDYWKTTTPESRAAGFKIDDALKSGYKTYGQFYKDDPEALKWGHYKSGELPGGRTDQFYGHDKNPYRYAEGFNAYMNTLPPGYKTLAGLGIDYSGVQDGSITSVVEGGKMVNVSPGKSASLAPVNPGDAAMKKVVG